MKHVLTISILITITGIHLLGSAITSTTYARIQGKAEEVTFQNGDITLSGTLSFPEGGTPKYKSIILVSGSGPQDRDSDIVGFKTFKILADSLNAMGYAVLRYDDRGVGQSGGKTTNESTSAELAEDARAAFMYLQSRPDIDPKRIGMLGHSEGGIVVPMVASMEPDVAFVILMAGYGAKGVEVSNAQQAAILRANGLAESFIEASGQMNREVFRLMMEKSTTDDQLVSFVKSESLKLLQLLPEAIQNSIPDKEGYATMMANQVLQQGASPWIQFYMNYDPLPTLKKIKCPVLLLFGELDTQVLPSQNANLMAEALSGSGHQKVKLVIFPKANHLFQEAVTGSPDEYMRLKKEFLPGFFLTINQWLSGIQ